ncbi:hypothetical protein [Desulfocastanea catecholica]
MVNGRNKKTGRPLAVVLLFVVLLALTPAVMADEPGGAPQVGGQLTTDNVAGYEKVIALLQEQDKKNSREFRQLKREIAVLGQQLEKPGIAEIIGGIGYIFGLFGVAAYVMSRKKNIPGEH